MRCGDLLSTSEKLEGCLGQVNTHTATCVSCCCAWVDPQMLTPKSVWGGYLIIEPPPHMFSSAEQKSPPFNTGWFESHLPCQKSLLVFLPGDCAARAAQSAWGTDIPWLMLSPGWRGDGSLYSLSCWTPAQSHCAATPATLLMAVPEFPFVFTLKDLFFI